MLSPYEREQLDNIARNEAFLDAIGLGNGKPGLIHLRRITSVRTIPTTTTTNSPQYPHISQHVWPNWNQNKLTDEFCIAEERGLL